MRPPACRAAPIGSRRTWGRGPGLIGSQARAEIRTGMPFRSATRAWTRSSPSGPILERSDNSSRGRSAPRGRAVTWSWAIRLVRRPPPPRPPPRDPSITTKWLLVPGAFHAPPAPRRPCDVTPRAGELPVRARGSQVDRQEAIARRRRALRRRVHPTEIQGQRPPPIEIRKCRAGRRFEIRHPSASSSAPARGSVEDRNDRHTTLRNR